MEKQPETRNETLASEIYSDLKKELKFLKILVAALIAALIILNLYHNWLWAQFDTITVDAGGGYSNLVQGDNGGGIYNGNDQSAPAEGRQS